MKDSSVEGYIPNAKALAAEIAVDLILNNLSSASLTAEGNTICDISINDLLGILDSSSMGDAVLVEAMDFVDAQGITNFVNQLLADLLDLEAISASIAGNQAFAAYEMTTAPWMVKISHNTQKDVLTFGIGANEDMAKSRKISLKLVSPSGDAKAVIDALAQIVDVDAQIKLEQPTYDAAGNTVTVSGSDVTNVNIDLTVDYDYMKVLTVILANGNPANKAELVAALNSGDQDALKAAVDALTVREVINAVKAVKAGTDFAAMAAKAGVTIDVAHAAELESVFHALLSLSGKALKVLNVYGPNTKLGSFDADNDGIYECSADTAKSGEVSRYGYTVAADVTMELNLTMKLFDDCLWGDANHDGVVDSMDATLVLRYYAGMETDLCLKRCDVNQDGEVNSMDATLILRYYAGLIEELPVKN